MNVHEKSKGHKAGVDGSNDTRGRREDGMLEGLSCTYGQAVFHFSSKIMAKNMSAAKVVR